MNDIFIGISTYNEMGWIGRQLESLLAAISEVPNLNVQIHYYDDCSDSKNSDKLKTIVIDEQSDLINLTLHRFTEHLGFGGVHAIMFNDILECKYTIFLDSDVLVPRDFLLKLCQYWINKNDDLGILSCISKKINNLYRETIDIEVKPPELATQLASYCFAFESKKYLEVGGVNPGYQGYFCDSDLCCRFARAGYKNYRIYSPYVLHAEHATMQSEKNNFNLKEIREHDKKIFMDYWKDTPENMEKHFLKEWSKNEER